MRSSSASVLRRSSSERPNATHRLVALGRRGGDRERAAGHEAQSHLQDTISPVSGETPAVS